MLPIKSHHPESHRTSPHESINLSKSYLSLVDLTKLQIGLVEYVYRVETDVLLWGCGWGQLVELWGGGDKEGESEGEEEEMVDRGMGGGHVKRRGYVGSWISAGLLLLLSVQLLY